MMYKTTKVQRYEMMKGCSEQQPIDAHWLLEELVRWTDLGSICTTQTTLRRSELFYQYGNLQHVATLY